MTDLDKPEIERQALTLLETLADQPDNPDLIEQLLATAHPAVALRVRRITGMASRRDTMPTELGEEVPPPFLVSPERFGPFRFLERIGHGGMGEVWRGERDDGLFEQIVAIKLIQPHLQVRAGEAFESERRILARFEHPGVARLIDGGKTDDGRACLVMEYVDGVAFDAGCAILPLTGRIGLFRQVLAAVTYAHGRLVAHGDLKPSNILVDGDGRVRLLDFGIARLITDEASAFLLSGAVTSSFASPARLEGAPPSIADDIFALGRLLEIALADLADPDLVAIAKMASACDETQRYGSVPEFAADIEGWLRGTPVRAMPRTALYVTRKFMQRNWKRVAASALLAIALVYAGWSFDQAERARAEATARFDDARGSARYLLFTLMDQLEARPNTLVLRAQVANVAQHYLDRLSTAENATPAVRLEAAHGLTRLAEAQGVPGYPNLDQPEAAARNLDSAVKLVGTSASPAAAELAIMALIDQSHVSSYMLNRPDLADGSTARAADILAHLPHPSAFLRAKVLAERADALSWKEQFGPSISAAQASLDLLKGQSDTPSIIIASRDIDIIALARYNLKGSEASIPDYESEVALLNSAMRHDTNSRELARVLARAKWQLGSNYRETKRYALATSILHDALTTLQAALAFDPDDRETAVLVEHTELEYAQTLAESNHWPEARTTIAANIELRRQQLRLRPNEPRRLRDLIVALPTFALLYGEHGQTVQACNALFEFARLVQKMSKIGDPKAMYLTGTLQDAAANKARFCPQ